MPGLFEDSHRRRGHGRAVSWCPPLTASLGVNAALAILLIILALRSRGGLGPDTIDLNKRLLLAEEGLERLRAGKPSQASVGGGSRPPWLTIGIPTVPRRQTGTKYLQRTLETLLDELPGGEEGEAGSVHEVSVHGGGRGGGGAKGTTIRGGSPVLDRRPGSAQRSTARGVSTMCDTLPRPFTPFLPQTCGETRCRCW